MLRSAVALGRRALRNTARRPQFAAPLLIFPTLFLALNVGGLEQTSTLPGFPEVNGFLDFQLGAAITQSLLIGGVSAGIATALEIEGGFFDRLVASPIPRSSIVVGRLIAVALLACIQVTWFLALGLIFGASIEGGIGGVLLIYLIGALAGVGFGAIGTMIALRARNASTVQGIFPLVFVVLFVSSAFFPQPLLANPIDDVARFNPLSYIAEGLRDPIVEGVTATSALEGIAAAGGVATVAILLSIAALRSRLGES